MGGGGGGAGGVGGLGGVGLAAGAGVGIGTASPAASMGVNTPLRAIQSVGAGQPAVKLALSPEALSVLARTSAALSPASTGSASALALIGVGAPESSSLLANTLVEAAVLAALLDNNKDNDKEKTGNAASALVMAAAMRAYQQVAALPGVSIATAVPGSGVTLSISSSAAA